MKFQMKMIIFFTLIILISEVVLSCLIYTSSVRLISDSVGTQAMHIAKSAAKTINLADLEKVTKRTMEAKGNEKELNSILDMPEYKNVRQQLWNFKNTNGIKFLYTMFRSKEGKITYIVDGFPLDYKGNDISMPGDVEKNTYPKMDLTFKEKKALVGDLTYDSEWGANVATYVPLFNSKGEFIGLLGAEIEASDIYKLLYFNKIKIITITCLVVLFTILISYLLTRLLVYNLGVLTKKVQEVRKGDLSVRSNISSKDEIGELSMAFDEMVGVFYDNKFNMDKMICDLSRASNYNDLEDTIIREVRSIVQFKLVDIFEYDGVGIQSKKNFGKSTAEIIAEYLKANLQNMKISDTEKILNGYIVIIGKVDSKYRILWMVGRSTDLSQRERLSIQLLARYISIFYENLSLIESMSRKIIDLENQSENSPWMSKLFLQISEKERKRLASDLHDEILQEIIRSKKAISNLLSNMPMDLTEQKKVLKNVENDLINTTSLIRETCNELLPSFLSEKGIVSSVEMYIGKVLLRANFNINFESFNVKRDLDYEEALTVYRVVQELLNNAMTHSGATEIDLMLRQDNDTFVIYYSDNGVGMNLETNKDTSKHLGLYNIRERIKALKGDLSFRSEAGKGLEVSCQFPIKSLV